MTHDDAIQLVAAIHELTRAVTGLGIIYGIWQGMRFIFGRK